MKRILILKFQHFDHFKAVRELVETMPDQDCKYNGGQRDGIYTINLYSGTSMLALWNIAAFCSENNIKPIVEVPTSAAKPTTPA